MKKGKKEFVKWTLIFLAIGIGVLGFSVLITGVVRTKRVKDVVGDDRGKSFEIQMEENPEAALETMGKEYFLDEYYDLKEDEKYLILNTLGNVNDALVEVTPQYTNASVLIYDEEFLDFKDAYLEAAKQLEGVSIRIVGEKCVADIFNGKCSILEDGEGITGPSKRCIKKLEKGDTDAFTILVYDVMTNKDGVPNKDAGTLNRVWYWEDGQGEQEEPTWIAVNLGEQEKRDLKYISENLRTTDASFELCRYFSTKGICSENLISENIEMLQELAER